MKPAAPMNRLLQSLRPAFALIFLLCLPVPATAQTPLAQGPGVRTYVVEGETLIEWYARENEIFFLQISDANDHLKRWTWAPVIEAGVGDFISYEFGGDTPKGFARLHYTMAELPEGETLESWDLDGDGLSNFDEITIHQTNPLKADTDGDGLSDGWEVAHGLDPNDPTGDNGADGDPDNDGVNNIGEYRGSTDPQDEDDFPPHIVIADRSGARYWSGHLQNGNFNGHLSANWEPESIFLSGPGARPGPADVSDALDDAFAYPESPVERMAAASTDLDPRKGITSYYTRNIGPQGSGSSNVHLQDCRMWLKVPPSLTENGPFMAHLLALHERSLYQYDAEGQPAGQTHSLDGVEFKELRVEQSQQLSESWDVQRIPQGIEGNFHDRISTSVGGAALRDIRDHGDMEDDVTIVPWDSEENIAEGNIAWIEAHTSEDNPAPRMPQLELRLPVLPEGVTLHAKLEVQYARGNGARPGRHQAEDNVKIPDQQANGGFQEVDGNVWRIWEAYENEPFFGGDATLTYKLMKGGDQVLAPQIVRFRIGGRNPDDTRCRAYIESRPNAEPQGNLWFAYAIARHESRNYNDNVHQERTRYNQFLELPGEGPHVNYRQMRTAHAGRPVFGDDRNSDGTPRGPGGYGLFQVTGNATSQEVDIPRQQIWNWQENVIAALDILASKRAESDTRMQSQRNQATVPLPALTVGGVTFQDGTNRTMEHASTIKFYNGASRPVFFTQIDGGGVASGFVIDPYSAGIFCYWRTDRRVQNGSDTRVANGIAQQVNPPGWALSRISSEGSNYVALICAEVE